MYRSLLVVLLLATVAQADDLPKVLDERLKLELIAEAPVVRTPTGIAIDEKGRVYVIESHTHFRPNDYDGPKHDRILRFEKKGDQYEPSVFFEGTTHTMNCGFHPDGSLYVATRMEIFKLHDKNDNGRIENGERTNLIRHETPGNYPHNGLSGFAFDYAGNVYFGQGENLGAEYKLVGSDGKTISGGGEGGNVYCCKADGSALRRVATGFWNPFHLYLDPYGRLFAVDNDPDSRPPCRLLHVVEGGDYGYRFRNGRKGLHPFTSWNGELPGTLPMMAGTGEAPSGILGYEHGGLGMKYAHHLFVTSWGDHRIERYEPTPNGASFKSTMNPFVVGSENFRPVGIAIHPDGSLWFSDWVDKSYQLHGKGRLWRLSDPKFDSAMFYKGKFTLGKLPSFPLPFPVRGTPDSERVALWSDVAGGYREIRQPNFKQFYLDEFRKDQHLLETVIGDVNTNPAASSLILSSTDFIGIDTSEARAKILDTLQSAKEYHPGYAALLLGGSLGAPHRLAESFDPTAFTGPKYPGEVRYAATRRLDPTKHRERLLELLGDADPFIQQAARYALKPVADELANFNFEKETRPGTRLGVALVLREANRQAGQKRLPELLKDSDPRVRFVAIQWIGEERLADVWSQVKDDLEKRLSTRQELEAYLATSAFLSKSYNPGQEVRGEEFVAKMLLDKNTSPERRAFLLRMLPPESKSVADNQLQQWLASDSPALRLAVLGRVTDGGLPKFLAESNKLSETALNAQVPLEERLEAIAAMAHDPTKHADTLKQLLDNINPYISSQASRTVRTNDQLAAVNSIAFSGEGRTPLNDVATWQQILEKQPGDPKSGELIFHHAIAQCSRCHEAEGRGAAIGPNLTGIGRTMSRERLIESILQPSKEIAPQFAVWQIETTDGRILKGMYFGEEVDGTVIYANEQGKTFKVHPRDVESRTQQKQSIMPEGLPYRLTNQELRDLIAYLSEGRQK